MYHARSSNALAINEIICSCGILKGMYELLLPILAIVSAVFILYGTILSYHWFRWALNRDVAMTASLMYFGIGGVLLIIMIGSAIALRI